MVESLPSCEVFKDGAQFQIRLHGSWTLECAEASEAACANIASSINGSAINGTAAGLIIDGSNLKRLDTSGAFVLINAIFKSDNKRDLHYSSFSADHEEILKVVAERWKPIANKSKPRKGFFASVGELVFSVCDEIRDNVAFVGAVSSEISAAILRPKLFRFRELVVQLELCCIRSLPVIFLVNGLIGLVVAYIFASQIQRYGASIFIVDGVVMAMSRELAPMIVAIVMGGRSGSSFTAQIGSMKVSQELDAIQMLGLSLLQVLVLPRVIALAISMPILVAVGDCVGIFGGMLIAQHELDLSFSAFLERMQTRIPIRHFVLGLIKAPVFAVFIALIGCRMGLSVKPDTRSVGLATTSTVVQSIVAVIILDALFAVLFMELGL